MKTLLDIRPKYFKFCVIHYVEKDTVSYGNPDYEWFPQDDYFETQDELMSVYKPSNRNPDDPRYYELQNGKWVEIPERILFSIFSALR